MRIYYICECCDKIIKCVECQPALPYEHEVIPENLGEDMMENKITCVKSLCSGCDEELKSDSAYKYIKEILYH